MKTIFEKPYNVERKWYVIDAEGVALGRVAVKAAASIWLTCLLVTCFDRSHCLMHSLRAARYYLESSSRIYFDPLSYLILSY